MYEWISDFGASWLRPLLWFVLLTVSSVATIYHTNGATIATEGKYVDVFAPLNDKCVNTIESELFCAIYLGIQPINNPLGIFNRRAIVIPQNWRTALLTWAQSLLSIVLITLVIFSLRRRFRIQAK